VSTVGFVLRAGPHWLFAAALAVVAFAGTGSAAGPSPCVASQLTGTFRVVPGSAGAGNIVYALRLRNTSTRTCFVSGLAQLRLLGKTGRALPTHVTPAFRPGLTAVLVTLRPGKSARAEARFSPDVPGVGEPVTGRQCEPTAYKLRVTPPPGGGTLVAPVLPPTPICEHGGMSLKALTHA
jgi:uncharacterized protein DUF4232